MIRTFSKVHGLAGLRVGWGYCPASIAEIVNCMRHPNNVSSVAIAAAAAAIADRAHIAAVRAANLTLGSWFARELRQIGFVPCDSHGNFVLLPFASPAHATAAKEFLKARGILVRPMAAYGLDRCLRITLGVRDDMQAVVDALRLWRTAA
jgi:histidinol-phosphate aminotransferase